MKQNETILQFIERTILHKPTRSLYEGVQPFQFVEMSYVIGNKSWVYEKLDVPLVKNVEGMNLFIPNK